MGICLNRPFLSKKNKLFDVFYLDRGNFFLVNDK